MLYIRVIFIKLIKFFVWVFYEVSSPISCICSKIAHIRSIWYRLKFRNCGESFFGKRMNIIGGDMISIGNSCFIGDNTTISFWRLKRKKFPTGSGIYIENNCSIGAYNHITCINRVVIGQNCLTGKFVTITDNDHGNTDLHSFNRRWFGNRCKCRGNKGYSRIFCCWR